MNNVNLAEELDQALESVGAEPGVNTRELAGQVEELLSIAAELRSSPDPEFRAQLKGGLMEGAFRPAAVRGNSRLRRDLEVPADILPTLSGKGVDSYPLHQRSFAVSLAMHVLVVALAVGSGVLAAQREKLKPFVSSKVLLLPGDVALSLGPAKPKGGGGGGAHDKLPASTGTLPRFAPEQIAPPTIVVRNQDARLTVPPTLVGPPNVVFPRSAQLGDPLSAALTPSNGPGSGAGIGSGDSTGVGTGRGPGWGDGRGGGLDGGFYNAGAGSVTAPRPIYDPEPEYSDEARTAKYQGNVVLWVVVGTDGRPRDLRVQQSLGMGLDEKALAAVRTWRFEPGMKDGHPVAVQVGIVVIFRLY